MNTISLVLNGKTAADIAMLPEKQRASVTTVYARPSTPLSFTSSPTLTSSPSLSGASTPRQSRPRHKRSPQSRDSPGWYNTEGGMTLDDFAKRLSTRLSRFEQWQGKCAQSVVMALMRPTPIALFAFNPVALLIWIGLLVWWFSGRVGLSTSES